VALVDSDFSILGHTGVRVGERLHTEWGTRKSRAMLAVLLTRHHQWVSVDWLLDWMWAEEDQLPMNPAGAFYKYANQVRAVLNRAGMSHLFHQRQGGYRIDATPSGVDYFQAREALDRARAALEPRRVVEVARQIVDRWTDVPLADVLGPPAERWRVDARERVLMSAYDLLCEKLIALGEHAAVLEVIEDLPEYDGANLMLSMRALEALHGLGRTGEASVFLDTSSVRLEAEFGEGAARTLRRFHEELRARRRPEPAVVAPRLDLSVPHQLPPAVVDFTGRDALLAKLTATAIGSAVRPRPCVIVLDGRGGVGKTQLALHWGQRLAGHFPDGQLYIDLNGFSDSPRVTHTAVIDRFLVALGQAPDRIPEPDRRAARLQAALNGRHVLVVLDNAIDADQVRPLLPLLSTCVVVVTSRDRLNDLAMNYGCQHFHVEPLSGQHGADFLAVCVGERAREEGAPLTELVELCDGLPIALRLLANLVNARPTAALRDFARRLREDLGVLDQGGRGMSAVFSWSYQALRAEHARMFRLLGLHPGPDITVEAAAAMVGVDRRRARKALDALVGVNLLEQPFALDHYRFHDIMRPYAVEYLADEPEGGLAQAEERMFDFYLHTAKNADNTLFPGRHGYDEDDLGEPVAGASPIVFTDSETARRWCVRTRDTLTAVIQYAASLGRHDVAATLPQMVGQILTRYGMHTTVLANLALALESAVATGSIEAEANVLHNIGHVHLVRQEYGLAEECFTNVYRKFLELGHEVGMAVSLHSGARVLVEIGNVVMGIDSHARALRMIRAAGNKALEMVFLHRMGEAHRRALDFDQAAIFYRESLELAEALGDRREQGVCLVQLAALYYERGDPRAAREYCARMLADAERTHDVPTAGTACNVLAAVEFDAGNDFEAKQYARKAVQLCRRVRDARGEATALDVLARLLRRAAQHDGAKEAWVRAKAIFRDLAMTTQVDEIGRELAELDGHVPSVPESRSRSAPTAWRGRALS
jgi:tetratricopeptide (TPR) repeat protein/DNA-binding SARP family transcriptional activator